MSETKSDPWQRMAETMKRTRLMNKVASAVRDMGDAAQKMVQASEDMTQAAMDYQAALEEAKKQGFEIYYVALVKDGQYD